MSKRTAPFTPNERLRLTLINRGVANLKEFGYPDCTADNILTDQIYSAFFRSMLEDNLGKGPADETIKGLLAEIDARKKV